MERECKRNISRHFQIFQKTTCDPAISWLYHCISWYIQGSCSTGHIDKSRGTPTSLLETGDPHVLFTKGVSILTIWQVRKFAPKVMQVSWWHRSRKVFVSVVFVVTPCSARNLMKFAVQKKTSLAGPPQKKEHVFFQSLLRRSFVEICWGSHVSTSKSRGLCRDWRGWFRNDWPPRAAWPFQKSQGFVTSQRLKVRLHDSGSRIRFVLLLSGFGTRNKLVFCGDSTPWRMLRVSKINLDQLPIELNSEHVSSLEDVLFVNALWKVPIDRLVLDTLTVDGKKIVRRRHMSWNIMLLWFTICLFMCWVGKLGCTCFNLLKGNGCINAFFFRSRAEAKMATRCLVDPTQNFLWSPLFCNTTAPVEYPGFFYFRGTALAGFELAANLVWEKNGKKKGAEGLYISEGSPSHLKDACFCFEMFHFL